MGTRELEEQPSWDAGPIAFWRLDPPELLWRLADGKSRKILLTDQPARVICGILDDSHHHTYSGTFEVYEPVSGKLIRSIELRDYKP